MIPDFAMPDGAPEAAMPDGAPKPPVRYIADTTPPGTVAERNLAATTSTPASCGVPTVNGCMVVSLPRHCSDPFTLYCTIYFTCPILYTEKLPYLLLISYPSHLLDYYSGGSGGMTSLPHMVTTIQAPIRLPSRSATTSSQLPLRLLIFVLIFLLYRHTHLGSFDGRQVQWSSQQYFVDSLPLEEL